MMTIRAHESIIAGLTMHAFRVRLGNALVALLARDRFGMAYGVFGQSCRVRVVTIRTQRRPLAAFLHQRRMHAVLILLDRFLVTVATAFHQRKGLLALAVD